MNSRRETENHGYNEPGFQDEKQFQEEERTPLYSVAMSDGNQDTERRLNDQQSLENEDDLENDDLNEDNLNDDPDRDYDEENRNVADDIDAIGEEDLQENADELQERDSIFDDNSSSDDSDGNGILRRDNIHDNDDIDPYFQKNSNIAQDLHEDLKGDKDAQQKNLEEYKTSDSDEYKKNNAGQDGNEEV